jgi:hypothetical protein
MAETERLSLELLDNGLHELSDRLDHLEDVSADSFEAISKSVLKLQAAVAELVKKEREPVDPQPWAARATPQDWTQLIEWVDWINSAYSILAEYQIHPCWPAHPGVVEELAAVRRAWVRAMVSDSTAKHAGSAEITAWHDRWLWATIMRFKEGHYRISNCSEKHNPERVKLRPTDHSLLPPSAVGPETNQP